MPPNIEPPLSIVPPEPEREWPSFQTDRIERGMDRLEIMHSREYERMIIHEDYNRYFPEEAPVFMNNSRYMSDERIENVMRILGSYQETTPAKNSPKLGRRELLNIDKEAIEKILRESAFRQSEQGQGSELLSDEILEPSPSIGLQLVDKYYSLFSGKDSQRDQFPRYSEQLFVEAVQKTKLDIPAEVDDRIIRSQHSALHSLLFSGGLDSLYEQYLQQAIDEGSTLPENPEQIVEIKTALAFDFLEGIASKNQEKEYSEVESGPITVGVEVEYRNYITQELRSKSVFEELLNTLDGYADNATSQIEKVTYKRYADKIRKRLDRLNLILENLGEKNSKDLFDENEPGTKAAIDLQILNQSLEIGAKEITTRPSRSYKTQLRELLKTASLGGLNTEWGVHETFGGIKLSKEHTEFMDALPMVAAAGLLDFDLVKDSLAQNVELGYAVIGERHAKTDFQSGESIYFPFHKPRRSYALEMFSPGDENKAGIELRSLPEYKIGSFPKFVRQLSFHFYFAHSVKSLQKSPDQRTDQDKQLIESHKKLMLEWEAVLREKGVSLPADEGKYVTEDTSDSEKKESNPYMVFLSNVLILGQRDSAFTKRVRQMISSYSSQIKTILENDNQV